VQQDTTGRPATQRIGNRPDLRQAMTQLGVGGKTAVKDVKDIREGGNKNIEDVIKDKEFQKDQKDMLKDRKEVIKEVQKEMKDKDVKEFKEKERKEFKEIREFGGIDVIRPTGASDLEGRLQNLEQAVNMLSHFISGELRPDLQGALFQQGEEAEKNAADSKTEYDYLDPTGH
jgi:hypothetical protein